MSPSALCAAGLILPWSNSLVLLLSSHIAEEQLTGPTVSQGRVAVPPTLENTARRPEMETTALTTAS